jgi:hypothetical protein
LAGDFLPGKAATKAANPVAVFSPKTLVVVSVSAGFLGTVIRLLNKVKGQGELKARLKRVGFNPEKGRGRVGAASLQRS